MNSIDLINRLNKDFPNSHAVEISSHGRIEIIGNHTDHNNGLCLVGAVDLGIFGALGKNDTGDIAIQSEGFPQIKTNINDLEIKEEEKGTSLALVKGVLKGFLNNGLKVGGFYIYCYSTIFDGAGVSSSACYESLICKALNYLYNEDKVSPLVMAKISQYSEREYFGKPCGMLDQVGACNGGVCFLDFKEGDPYIEPVPFDLPLKIVLVNTGGSHANLTPYYASIPSDMKAVAQYFGKNVLREVPQEDYYRALTKGIPSFTNKQLRRAQHFFDENIRVLEAFKAVKQHDTEKFLNQIKLTQMSSQDYLENTQVDDQYAGSPQQAVDRANKYIKKGACRIMGGGFAGSIIAFVSPEECDGFKKYMSGFYGEDKVAEISIPSHGPLVVDK